MRDPKQDAVDMAERRQKLLETAFHLFADNSIEAVKLQDIASKSGIGIATLYRYFGNKQDLVIEIGTLKWHEYYEKVEKSYAKLGGDAMNAAAELDFFLECMIELYRNHKDVLRFNRNFDAYVKHEGCSAAQMKPYNDAVSVFAAKFHRVYSKAMEDGTLDIRVSEDRLFINLLYIMLSVESKYAEGLIYPPEEERDMTEELYALKSMILNAYQVK